MAQRIEFRYNTMVVRDMNDMLHNASLLPPEHHHKELPPVRKSESQGSLREEPTPVSVSDRADTPEADDQSPTEPPQHKKEEKPIQEQPATKTPPLIKEEKNESQANN